MSKGGLLPHRHRAPMCGCVVIYSCPQRSMAFQERCGPRRPTCVFSVSSRGLGPLGWNAVVDLCGRSSDLVLPGPAAGVLGCRSARRYLCGHFPASGSHVAVHTVALPTDGVAVGPAPAITAQGAARPIAAPSAIQVTCGSCPPWRAKAEAADGITRHARVAVALMQAAISKRA